MKVINLFGGPGAGKSTTAAGAFHKMKLMGKNVELVTEFAKDLTWDERKMELDDQLFVLAHQHHRLWRLREKVDYVVTDSPLLLNLLYVKSRHLPDSFNSFVADVWNSYTNINYVIKRVKAYTPIGRNQTECEARHIDTEVDRLLDTMNIECMEVNGDESAVDIILNWSI